MEKYMINGREIDERIVGSLEYAVMRNSAISDIESLTKFPVSRTDEREVATQYLSRVEDDPIVRVRKTHIARDVVTRNWIRRMSSSRGFAEYLGRFHKMSLVFIGPDGAELSACVGYADKVYIQLLDTLRGKYRNESIDVYRHLKHHPESDVVIVDAHSGKPYKISDLDVSFEDDILFFFLD